MFKDLQGEPRVLGTGGRHLVLCVLDGGHHIPGLSCTSADGHKHPPIWVDCMAKFPCFDGENNSRSSKGQFIWKLGWTRSCYTARGLGGLHCTVKGNCRRTTPGGP